MFRPAYSNRSVRHNSLLVRTSITLILMTFLSFGALRVSTAEDCSLTEFPVPTPFSGPIDITTGPDGNLWFTESNVSAIGRITPSGVITEFPISTIEAPGAITTGPDGNLWFTTQSSNKIGRITTLGSITLFPVPTFNSFTVDITAGPDGNLWFTEANAGKIGRITTDGVITEFLIPTVLSAPFGITSGPDGNIWFAEQGGNKIGRITPSGVITEFPVPTSGSAPTGITVGPDGNLWFTQFFGPGIGKITPDGVITEFPAAVGNPIDITVGPDGNLWFVDFSAIRQFSTSGNITKSCLIENTNERFVSITSGPDGNIWVTNNFGNKVVKLELAQPPPAPSFDLCVQNERNGEILEINSTTGEYRFTKCVGLTIGGLGSLIKKGSLITLQHYSSDRRVLARIDSSIRRGTASIQILPQGLTINISDKNIANNSCTCQED